MVSFRYAVNQEKQDCRHCLVESVQHVSFRQKVLALVLFCESSKHGA